MRHVMGRFTFAVISPALFAMISSSAFGLTLDQVKQALAERGHKATWAARDSGAHESLGIGERENPFGLIDEEFQLNVIPTEDIDTRAIPRQFDWRNVNGVNWVSPVKNQGKCGSCVAFASVGVAEGMLNIAAKNPNLNLDLSEEYLFSNIGNCNSGSQLSTASSSLKSRGTVDEACLPYMAGRLGTDPVQSKACSDAAQRLFKTTSYTSLYSASSVKAAVLKGPVMTSMTVYEDFMFYGSGVYQHVTGNAVGGHAITIVGFNDDDQYWIVKNSWADTWGEGGFFRIRYGDESGLGNSGNGMVIADPQLAYRIQTPAHLSAAAKNLDIALVSTAKQRATTINYTLTSRRYNRAALSGVIPADSLKTGVSVADFDDGSYELKVTAQGASRSDNVIVVIANKKPDLKFEVVPDFQNTGTVSDRVYFSLKTDNVAVPLTRAELHFRKTDGSVDKKVVAIDPGAETQIGWRTTLVPNGTYEVWAVGKIGDLYEYPTPALRFEVKNNGGSRDEL